AGLQSDIQGNSPFDLLAGTIPSSALETYLGIQYIPADNGQTRIYSAMIMPEMMRQDTLQNGETNILGMTGLAGTLCHEFVHVLGGFDLYDVTGNSMGVGAWSLMGFGGWLGEWSAGAPPGVIPGMLDAFHKVYFGWVEPLVLTMPKESIPIFCATMDTSRMPFRGDSTAPLIVKIPISQTEYFLIENRQTDVSRKDTIVVDTLGGVLVWVEDGEYDFFLPGSGILIWHIDEQVIAEYGPYNAINIFPQHKGVDLEEADGIQDFDQWSGIAHPDYQIYGCQYDPFFIGGFNSAFTDSTTPNSDGYYGKSHIKVYILSTPDTVMNIRFNLALLQNGFPKDPGRGVKMLSATYADLDRDGNAEIILADSSGRIYAWHADGSSYLVNLNGSFANIPTSIIGAVAVGDVSGDDKLEVIAAGEDGRVFVYPYSGIYPNVIMNTSDRILASPVLADLDGDGKKEIIVGATDMKLYIWKGDGTVYSNFPLLLNSEFRSSVAITDTINPQIVTLGTDNTLFLINADGTIAPNFPISLSNSPLFTTVPPVVADIDQDGNKEIITIINTGANYQLYVVSFTGQIKYSSSPVIQGPVNTAPMLADIDNDGFLEVVFAGNNKIYAFNFNGTLQTNYPFQQDSVYTVTEVLDGWLISYDVPFIFNSSPIMCDVNQDSILDIIIGSPKYGVLGLNGQNGRLLNYFPLATVGAVSATPLIQDIDNDSDIEIVIGSDRGILYVWDLPTPNHEITWNQYLKDPGHTNLLTTLPTLPSSPDTIVKNFYVYPNPAENDITIRYWLGKNVSNVKINILDIAGNPIKEINNAPAVALTDNEKPLSLRNLPSGIYLVRLEITTQSKKEVKFYKFAIVK
ncbi:MAG: FG-GAP-like repeat-containing protein, partial [candidate division WOR-3 bacterium]